MQRGATHCLGCALAPVSTQFLPLNISVLLGGKSPTLLPFHSHYTHLNFAEISVPWTLPLPSPTQLSPNLTAFIINILTFSHRFVLLPYLPHKVPVIDQSNALPPGQVLERPWAESIKCLSSSLNHVPISAGSVLDFHLHPKALTSLLPSSFSQVMSLPQQGLQTPLLQSSPGLTVSSTPSALPFSPPLPGISCPAHSLRPPQAISFISSLLNLPFSASYFPKFEKKKKSKYLPA